MAAHYAKGGDDCWWAGWTEDTVHGLTMKFGYPYTMFVVVSDCVNVTLPSQGIL